MTTTTTPGQWLRRYMDDRKLSVKFVAERADVSRQTLYALMADTHPPSRETQRGVAEALGVEVDWWDRVANGDEPVRVDAAADPDDVTRLRAAVESLALAVRRIALVTGVSLDDLQLLDATHDDPPDARGQP